MTEMILGSRKPDVYTVLWELTEDDRSRFFYKWRREKYLYGGFDVSGKIVVFYAPAHPLDNEIPARHFASNDPVFDLFINIIKGVDKEDVDTMSIRGRSYAETYALFDELLTEKFGYGNRTLIASDIVFPCEIEVYPGVKNESKA
ncbi:MAG: hypothetical protein II155_03290 [Clostridia bacterium]|nr:hypothetical protein [Clostridia bacterium]